MPQLLSVRMMRQALVFSGPDLLMVDSAATRVECSTR